MSDYSWVLSLAYLISVIISVIIGLVEVLSDCFKEGNVSENNNEERR